MAMSVQRVKGTGTNKDDCDESSGSENETEPAKSFLRRLSTNKDIKCSVCFKYSNSSSQNKTYFFWLLKRNGHIHTHLIMCVCLF